MGRIQSILHLMMIHQGNDKINCNIYVTFTFPQKVKDQVWVKLEEEKVIAVCKRQIEVQPFKKN